MTLSIALTSVPVDDLDKALAFYTEKLGIRHVPALVSQEGKKLKIEEILR